MLDRAIWHMLRVGAILLGPCVPEPALFCLSLPNRYHSYIRCSYGQVFGEIDLKFELEGCRTEMA